MSNIPIINKIKRDRDKLTKLHNELVPELVTAMISSVTAYGGDPPDIMVMLESVIFGTITQITKPERVYREAALNALMKGVRVRFDDADARLRSKLEIPKDGR